MRLSLNLGNMKVQTEEANAKKQQFSPERNNSAINSASTNESEYVDTNFNEADEADEKATTESPDSTKSKENEAAKKKGNGGDIILDDGNDKPSSIPDKVQVYYDNGEKFEKVTHYSSEGYIENVSITSFDENGNRKEKTVIKYDKNEKMASSTTYKYKGDIITQKTTKLYDENNNVKSEKTSVCTFTGDTQWSRVDIDKDDKGNTKKKIVLYNEDGTVQSETSESYQGDKLVKKVVYEYKYDETTGRKLEIKRVYSFDNEGNQKGATVTIKDITDCANSNKPNRIEE